MKKQDANGIWHSAIPSWVELKRMARAGAINQVLSEGDLIPIRLANGEENSIQVTHDQKENMFFVFKHPLCVSTDMHVIPTNQRCWSASNMRIYLEGDVFDLLPDDMQAAIHPVQIRQKIKDGSFTFCFSRLFLLSEGQVFGKCIFSDSEEGVTQLECFKGSNLVRKKYGNGTLDSWWLRSPYLGTEDAFVAVNFLGDASLSDTNSVNSVLPAFCLIEPKK